MGRRHIMVFGRLGRLRSSRDSTRRRVAFVNPWSMRCDHAANFVRMCDAVVMNRTRELLASWHLARMAAADGGRDQETAPAAACCCLSSSLVSRVRKTPRILAGVRAVGVLSGADDRQARCSHAARSCQKLPEAERGCACRLPKCRMSTEKRGQKAERRLSHSALRLTARGAFGSTERQNTQTGDGKSGRQAGGELRRSIETRPCGHWCSAPENATRREKREQHQNALGGKRRRRRRGDGEAPRSTRRVLL